MIPQDRRVRLELDREGPTPIYQQIENWIQQQILDGHWPEHYKLNSEVDLAHELDVSRGTVRKAISDLTDEGLLVRIQGRGTFVASNCIEQPLAQSLITFSEDLISRQISFETRVLEQSVERPNQRVASLLSVPPDASVLYLKRVRVVRGMPLILLENHVSIEHCPGIESVDFTNHRLFEALEELHGLTLDWGQRTFEAQVADSALSDALDVADGSPVMYMEQITYLESGEPVELSDLWFRGDHLRVSAAVRRKDASGKPLGRLIV